VNQGGDGREEQKEEKGEEGTVSVQFSASGESEIMTLLLFES